MSYLREVAFDNVTVSDLPLSSYLGDTQYTSLVNDPSDVMKLGPTRKKDFTAFLIFLSNVKNWLTSFVYFFLWYISKIIIIESVRHFKQLCQLCPQDVPLTLVRVSKKNPNVGPGVILDPCRCFEIIRFTNVQGMKGLIYMQGVAMI